MRNRILFRFTVAALTALIAACGNQTEEPIPASPMSDAPTSVSPSAVLPSSVSIEKKDLPGIVNFSRIDAATGLAGSPVGFGGETQRSAMSGIREEGFRTVVNLRLVTERGADVAGSRDAAAATGLNYVHLPFGPRNLDASLVDEFVAVVGNAENRPVYIHCGSATRAAALWMIGRVQADGLSIEAATAEARLIAAKPDSAISMAERYLASQTQ